MNGLHPQRPDASPDQPASPPAAARRPRLTPVGIAVIFLLMLAVGALPAAWATPGPDNGTVPTPTSGPCGPTEVTGGIINTDTIWYKTCSPFTVTGNLLVDSGATLTIEPGVVVQFASGKGLQINGTLIARGASSNPIVFTSAQASPAAGDWVNIFFANASLDAAFDGSGNYTSGSILEYCEVRYGGGTNGNGTVRVDSAAPFINHCVISNSASNGLYLSQSSSRITNSTITNSAQTGIYINNYPGGGAATVSNNTISNNTQDGLYAYFYGGQTATFSGNTIQNNGGAGIRASSGYLTISGNTIGSNRNSGINIDGGGCTNAEITNNTLTNNSAGSGGGINANPGWCSTTHTIANNTLTNNQASTGGALYVGSGGSNHVYVRDNTIQSNTATGNAVIYFGGATGDEFVRNTVTGNTDTHSSGMTLYLNGLVTVRYNNLVNPNHAFELYNNNGSGGGSLDATYNWWGTTDASSIATKIYDFNDDFSRSVVIYSPLLGATYITPILGPANPSVSITGYAGTTANPVVNLTLAAMSATQMRVTDDHTFPPQFTWEPFATAKDFHTTGTQYIYARFRDATLNESAIAFAKPQRIMYIQKSSALANLPALIQARVAADVTAAQARAAAVGGAAQVMTFYRPIGATDYTSVAMTLVDGIRTAWIPASAMVSGIEYYLQVEDGDGNVVATLPESNPATNPFTLAALSTLAQSLQAAADNVFELAVGLTFDVPAGALTEDTDLRVSALGGSPTTPAGITATTVGYSFELADGSTAFDHPITVIFVYSDDQAAGLSAADLRVYYLDNGVVRLAGGTVDTTRHTITLEIDHFSDFFLAEGSAMDPAAVTAAVAGDDVTISARVVDYLPVRSATLHYQAGGGDWQSLTMTQVGEGYQATIPAAQVTLAGLAYYVEASDGVSTATYPAADPVNSPQTITVSPRPAPAAVSDLGGDLAGDQLTLTWSPVTQDIDGGAITVDHYVIYRRAGEPYFIPTPTDLIASDVTGTSYIDTVAAGGDYFYGVVAVDSHDGVSSVSNRLGVFSFSLTPGSGS